MDKNKLDRVLDKIMNDPKAISRVADEVARRETRQKDAEALEFGIERLTVFLHEGSPVLLIKPMELFPAWQINAYEHGHFSIEKSAKIEFVLTTVSDRFRFTISAPPLLHWVDLEDGRMAEELAEFLKIEIS